MASNGVLFFDPRDKPLSSTGAFMPACYRWFYLTQTLTPAPAYADGALSTPLSLPVIAASDGRFPQVYLDPTITYRIQLFNSSGVLLDDTDPYIPLATVPASAPQTLTFITNNKPRGTIDSAGRWTINPPDTSGQSAVIINGLSGDPGLTVLGGTTSGSSKGLLISGGTTTADYALQVQAQGGATTYFEVVGDGEVIVNRPTTAASVTSTFSQVGYLDAPARQLNSSGNFVIGDRGGIVERTGGSGPFTWTIQPNATTAFPTGAMILLCGLSGVTGVTNLVPAGGVTLYWPQGGATGSRVLGATGFMVTLVQLFTDNWMVGGAGVS